MSGNPYTVRLIVAVVFSFNSPPSDNIKVNYFFLNIYEIAIFFVPVLPFPIYLIDDSV